MQCNAMQCNDKEVMLSGLFVAILELSSRP
jgi:hypothetical protein